MAKSSGTTRGSSSSNPRALGGNGAGGRSFDNDIRLIKKTGFKDMGGGVWELNTPNADTSIVYSETAWGDKVYELNIVGAMGKNGVYTTSDPNRRFSSLNAAKQAAREELEDYYRKVNR